VAVDRRRPGRGHRGHASAEEEGVDILAVDERAAVDGLRAWHDAGLWHRAKQEVGHAAAPMYGELVGRWIAAKQGRSFKCLVLDLDNTLWGGVIGDDGLAGIKLGQGSAAGEAHAAFQQYAKDLARRGIIAVPVHPGWVRTDMGGASATLVPADSIAGLRRLIARLTAVDSGRFWNWDGTEMPW
jgi:hypothetical protein